MLLKYAYSADASTVPDKELTVYALEDSSEIRQAISAFQKEHADIYVNLKIGRSGDNAVTADDALRTLNSDIMAGEGPDVIILDGMPVDNYIEKGLLMDISDVAEEIKKTAVSSKISVKFIKRMKNITDCLPVSFCHL